MILVYGNKYTENKEEVERCPDDSQMYSVTLDYLDAVEFMWQDENGELPEGWYESIFWGTEG